MSKLDALRAPLTTELKEAIHHNVETYYTPFNLDDNFSHHNGPAYLQSTDIIRDQKKTARQLYFSGLFIGELVGAAIVTIGNVKKVDRGPIYYIGSRIDSIGDLELSGYTDDGDPVFAPLKPGVVTMADLIKLRTMRNGSDRRHVVGNKVEASDESTTAAGKMLREKPFNILDETPQLRQAMRGDIFVVAPRGMIPQEAFGRDRFNAYGRDVDCFNKVNEFISSTKNGIVGPEVMAGEREFRIEPQSIIQRDASVIAWTMYASPEVNQHVLSEGIKTVLPVIKPKYEKQLTSVS